MAGVDDLIMINVTIYRKRLGELSFGLAAEAPADLSSRVDR